MTYHFMIDVDNLGTCFFPLYSIDFGKSAVAKVVIKSRILDNGVDRISHSVNVPIVDFYHVFKDFGADDIAAMYSAESGSKVFFDVKGIYDKEEFENAGFNYWRL